MQKKHVADIRAFNRFYTGVLGLLDQHILDSRYSLPEVRVLYELYHSVNLTASEIIAILRIDKGYLSRMLLQFQKKKLVSKKWSARDGRAAHLSLTEKGRNEFEALNEASNRQIKDILERLTEDDCNILVGHMTGIRTILSKTK
ncbi:MAG: MarR family winged helix-turn-helix transcriptional regulator [Chitinophagales bacterium]